MYWREVPYRALLALRGLVQSRGWFSAVPAPREASDARWGLPWCHPPSTERDVSTLFEAATRLMNGDLEVFGRTVAMRDGIPDWNADPVTGTRIGLTFGPFIDFRHVGDGVDIKYLWEINRHLWWVTLAQCYTLSHDAAYLHRLRTLLTSWLNACPYPLGANWSSPVEHGVRLVNWSAVWHLVGGASSPMFDGEDGRRLRDQWLDSIIQHIQFVSQNYSLYSSANNHLVGEATGVFVAAHTWDRWLPARRLREQAKRILEREALRQFSEDGVNLEQAIGYHKFCLQFLLAAALAARANHDDFSSAFWSRIENAMTFLASMMDSAGNVPAIGDSDDGEVWRFGQGATFDSFKSLLAIGAALFARGDLQAKVDSVGAANDPQVPWLLTAAPPPVDLSGLRELPTRFEVGGYVVLGNDLHDSNEFRVTFDCGPLGFNRIAGHGHADALSVLVSWGGESLLVDSGTYCYNAAPQYRQFFRGTRAHNTLLVDDLDQSDYGGSFLWLRDVNSTVMSTATSPDQSVHAMHDGYARLHDPVTHHRRVTLISHAGRLLIEDWLDCRSEHEVELLWHAAPGARFSRTEKNKGWMLEGARHALRVEFDADLEASVIEGCESPPQGWVSSRFYEKRPSQVLCVRMRLSPRQVISTTIARAGSWNHASSRGLETTPYPGGSRGARSRDREPS